MTAPFQFVLPQARVYVLCPADAVTGGPELLHQLVHALRQQGREAFIAYLPLGGDWATPPPYARYGCPVVREVPDGPDAAVVVAETFTRELHGFRRARRVIWWLSVDNYLGSLTFRNGWKIMLRRLLFSDIRSAATTAHLFQSVYARDFVRRRFGADGLMLSDYLASDFLEPAPAGPRADAIAYNPSKDSAFTRRFMRRRHGFAFVRLERMSRADLRAALQACKVYIDFGIHPGKDRIPREAAMCGAVVIVGRRGSAAFDEDVPLDAGYKIDSGPGAASALERLVVDIFANYPRHYAAQQRFRAGIAAEPQRFEHDVRTAFPGPGHCATDGAGVLGVVVTYNPGEGLGEHLRTLRSQCAALVVVDNGSSNAEWVRQVSAQSGARLVRNSGNLGIACALNQAARIAMEEGFYWLAAFDQDSLCPTAAIERLLALYAVHPRADDIGVLSMRHRDRVLQRDYHHALDILEQSKHGRVLRSAITSGSLFRVDLLRRYGGFDDGLFIDMVDHEFCLRLRRHGWLVVEALDVVMEHSIGEPVVHRLFGLPVVATNHSAARRYYRVRNQLEVSRRCFFTDPVWSVKGVLQLVSPAVAVLLFEQQRWPKLVAMVSGIRDFALRRFGAMR